MRQDRPAALSFPAHATPAQLTRTCCVRRAARARPDGPRRHHARRHHPHRHLLRRRPARPRRARRHLARRRLARRHLARLAARPVLWWGPALSVLSTALRPTIVLHRAEQSYCTAPRPVCCSCVDVCRCRVSALYHRMFNSSLLCVPRSRLSARVSIEHVRWCIAFASPNSELLPSLQRE